ncbi:efflux RND transporter periplasmic adaptor subunit [Tundrisphaera lichenicola]|uniref:efflux RND transporter periplasmic adaptor subunit n=1 Tax=Tundrisphaera lichenicola TaxID=2029860 RepID=UPI003EBEB7FE
MNGLRRAIVPILLLAAVPLGCQSKEAEKVEADAAPKPVPVTVADVEMRPIERLVDAVGTLKGWDEVTVGAKRVGRVFKVEHDIGDHVKPGELLVQFETIDADLAIEQAEKQLLAELAKIGVILKEVPTTTPSVDELDVTKLPSVQRLQVALERAQLNLTRERNLMNKGAGMRENLQNTEADVKAAEAALDDGILAARSTIMAALAAKVGLDVRRQARVDLEIRAPQPSQPPFGLKVPLTYAVTKRSVSEGQMIREGDPAYELVIENPLRLWMNLPERHAADVEIGQDIRVTVSSYPGRTFPGKVSRLNPRVDSTSRTFQVEAAVPNDEGLLRPGGFAKAEIVTDRNANAIIVPLDAIVRYAGVTKLFLVGDDKKAHSLPVETGKEGPGWVELIGTLPEKARVVTTGQSQLADDTPVLVRTPEAPPTTKPPVEAEAGTGG